MTSQTKWPPKLIEPALLCCESNPLRVLHNQICIATKHAEFVNYGKRNLNANKHKRKAQ